MDLRALAKEMAESISSEWYGGQAGEDWIHDRLQRAYSAGLLSQGASYQRGVVDALRAVAEKCDEVGSTFDVDGVRGYRWSEPCLVVLRDESASLTDITAAIEREGVEKVRAWLASK